MFKIAWRDSVLDALGEALVRDCGYRLPLAVWNDATGREFDQIIALIDRTLALLPAPDASTDPIPEPLVAA